MNTAVMFSKASDEWATPREFFEALDREFHFKTDAAATPENTQCAHWFGRPMNEDDGNALDWPWWLDYGYGPYWLNPPYSQVRRWVKKAATEARNGCTVVCLVPARTDTKWFHEQIYDATAHRWRPGVEVRFVKGRLKFGAGKNSAPFPSMVVIFRPPDGHTVSDE